MSSFKSSKKTPYLLVSTVSSASEGKKIARYLVTHKLSACVNIVPGVDSIFRWKGKVDRAKELLLLIKTSQNHIKAVEKAICRLHSYSVPEIIAVPIKQGHQPYLKWLLGSVS